MNHDIDNPNPVIKRRAEKVKIGIIGYGFVGSAVGYAFSTDNVTKFVVDPKYNSNDLDALYAWGPSCTFVCLPTPSNDDGSVDCSMVEEAVTGLISNSSSFIVIKSTIPPNVAEKLCSLDTRVVYEPEFLNEANAKMDYLNARFRVVGFNDQSALQYLEGVYGYCSLADPAQTIGMTPAEAAFFKYTVNTFLASKVVFMNQLKSIMDDFGGNYNMVSRALGADGRLGHTHTRIPGPDGKQGFGGACFPKDLSAFIHFIENETSVEPTLLKTVRSINNEIRSQYEISDREKEQNVNYGQTKEEQQDQNDGSPSNI